MNQTILKAAIALFLLSNKQYHASKHIMTSCNPAAAQFTYSTSGPY